MGVVQEKMYMNVDDVCEILGVSKAYAYNLMRGYNAELKKQDTLWYLGKFLRNFWQKRFTA